MSSLLNKYNQLKLDFENYQKIAEETMQRQNIKIVELDKKLDKLSLIVEISKYINKSLGISEIAPMINDIIIGILGVTYSSVYILENRKLRLKASNLSNTDHHYMVRKFNCAKISKLNASLNNSSINISVDNQVEIHSSLFMPIYLKDNILGVIIAEHHIYDSLGEDHLKLLTALSNQIAICLENNKLYNKITERSQKDGLTGLFNRRYFFNVMEDKLKNEYEPFAIVMIDIDNFKNCNDTFGHQYGDKVLKIVSKIIESNLRSEDIVARYGGEEIIVYMYGVKNINDVYFRMEIIRDIIEKTAIPYKDKNYSITVSIGISIVNGNTNEDLEQIIKRADVNLYKAKNLGKNRIVC